VRRQSLGLREQRHVARERPGAALVDLLDRERPEEVLGREPGEAARPAGGGEHVVAAAHVVAVRDRRPGADERRAGGGDAAGDGGRVGGQHGEVFGRVADREVDRLVERVDGQDGAGRGERLPADLGAGGVGELADERVLDLARDPLGGGDHDARGVGIVLGLGQHLGGGEPRVGGVVGEHEHLGGAGGRIDDDVAGDLGLGLGHPAVAGPDDRVDPGHGLGPVGERGDRPGSAEREQPVGPGDGARGEHLGGRASVRPGGRAHDDLPDAGGAGGHDAHEHRARVGRAAAGSVDAGPVHRDRHAGDPHAGFDFDRHLAGDLRRVERADVPGRPLERGAHGRVEAGERFVPRLARHFQRLELDAVEALGHVEQLGVAARTHVGDEPGDDVAHPAVVAEIPLEEVGERGGVEVGEAAPREEREGAGVGGGPEASLGAGARRPPRRCLGRSRHQPLDARHQDPLRPELLQLRDGLVDLIGVDHGVRRDPGAVVEHLDDGRARDPRKDVADLGEARLGHVRHEVPLRLGPQHGLDRGGEHVDLAAHRLVGERGGAGDERGRRVEDGVDFAEPVHPQGRAGRGEIDDDVGDPEVRRDLGGAAHLRDLDGDPQLSK
jgi:hypothetical protein